jgi:E3 ubiquitin-protein ligase HUWE1
VTEVNPEFLAALPPAIQEEVLAQQRLEQQRQAAAAANPNDPVDAAAFFQNLQPSLRQAVSESRARLKEQHTGWGRNS